MSRNHAWARGARKRKSVPFLEKGLQVLALAGALGLASTFLQGSTVLAGAAGGPRTALWLALAIGLGLLAAHFGLPRVFSSREARAYAPSLPSPAAEPAFTRPFQSSVPGSARRDQQWGPEVFTAIEWRRFEAVVEILYAQGGFDTRSQTHGPDGGVDIWLYSRHTKGLVSVVQCKHSNGRPVTVAEVRELLDLMVSKGLKRGTYATSSHFTADALAFAKAHGINPQGGHALLDLIARRSAEQQVQLLEVAYEGEYWRPTCARCGEKMSERLSRKDNSRFWGCVSYPRCRGKLPMREV